MVDKGVVTGATLLSVAAFHEGLRAQAFPSFGSERMGAPVVAYCRIARSEILLREPVLEPNAVIVQDPGVRGPRRRDRRAAAGARADTATASQGLRRSPGRRSYVLSEP